MSKFPICITLFLLISGTSYPQFLAYDWFAGKCAYSAEYDTIKYSRKQLDDTKILCYDLPANGFFTSTIEGLTPEKIANPDTNQLKNEYESSVKFIKSLSLVNSPF